MASSYSIFRGMVFHLLDSPWLNPTQCYAYFENGALVVQNGLVVEVGNWLDIEPKLHQQYAHHHVYDYSHKIIMPGFIDTHFHYAQCSVIGSYGKQLLDWLNDYTFPTEAKFADPNYAQTMAQHAVKTLLANGTTTASVFATVHPQSVDAFMQVCQQYNLRMLCGKVLMDTNCPTYLQDSAVEGVAQSQQLIEKWHLKQRLRYSVTPRFAPTSTPLQLQLAGDLYHSYPLLHVQSHLSENSAEVAWVKSLYPQARDYFDVYEQAGLVGERCIYGHGVHLTPREYQAMQSTKTNIAFCPTSNLFLGSGFFNLKQAQQHDIGVGLATDVGGGTSYSMFGTMASAYYVQQVYVQQQQLNPLHSLQAYYLSTLGAAQALGLQQFVGNFTVGKEADFIVINPYHSPELRVRLQDVSRQDISNILFALMFLGDKHCIEQTYIMGHTMTL